MKLRILCLCLFPFLPAVSVAGDGALEINQSCAVNTGCFPGDTAGFPVTLPSSGSYRLTSNLDTSADMNAVGIQIVGDDVTIDLNGFEIAGPVTCVGTGSLLSCTPDGSGRGINGSVRQATIRNGHVRGFGEGGIEVGTALVSNVTVSECSATGMLVGIGSTVSGVIVRQTGDATNHAGILAGSGSVIENSAVSGNFGSGIKAGRSTIIGNSAYDNGVHGILAENGSLVRNNTADLNKQDGIFCLGACQIGLNTVLQNGGDGIEAGAGSAIFSNVARSNGEFGLNLTSEEITYSSNVITDNSGTVTGGTGFFGNYCDSATPPTCP